MNGLILDFSFFDVIVCGLMVLKYVDERFVLDCVNVWLMIDVVF